MRVRLSLAATVIAILVAAAAVRMVALRADPPTFSPIGIIWHDEGAWVHNARNRALYGAWRADAWNPVFVTPVFTALEYGAFQAFGVGTWQARLVPVASGLAAVLLLMAGLAALGGSRGAMAGGAMLAVNYVFVMWNRAALIESTMTACIVASWASYALAERRHAWGLAAGGAAVLAWFTKAAAAFFVGALVIEVMLLWWFHARSERRTAVAVMAGLAATSLVALAIFVIPNWAEYRFYNWEMSVLRKPEYTLAALVDRASWLPLVQGVFARMWPVLVAAAAGVLMIAARGVRARPADRLLVLWLLLGLAELIVHDAGNERRYLMFVPVLIALAVRLVTADAPLLPPAIAQPAVLVRLAAIGLLLLLGYLVIGSAFRIVLENEVTAGRLSVSVRLATLLSAAVALTAALKWRAMASAVSRMAMSGRMVPALVVVAALWNVPDYIGWARHLGQKNYEASVALGEVLPPGALVHGKLANGMALENDIRPIFIGNGFGNYADRFARDDVRFVLTYDMPRLGYESSDGSGLIEDLLARYPARRVVATFDVDETPGIERAALIEKGPAAPATR